VATASSEGTVKVWDLARCAEAVVNKYRGNTFHSRGLGVTFTADGKHIFAMDANDGARLWDATTGVESAVLGGFKRMINSPNAPAQKVMLAGTNAIATGVSRDGRFLVAGGADVIRVYDAGTRQELRTIQAFRATPVQGNKVDHRHGDLVCLALSPDGNRIFALGKDRDEKYRDQPALRVFDTATGKELSQFPSPPPSAGNLALSPDGRHLAGAVGNEVWVWDAATGIEVRRWATNSGGASWVTYRADGKEMATAGADGTVSTWDPESGRRLLRLKSQAAKVHVLAYHPDGVRLASGGEDGTVQVWDLEGGQEALSLRGHPGLVAGLAFSPDGRRLAAMGSGGEVTVWDAIPLDPNRPVSP
jgi:WD40 repeat protein